MFMGFGLIFTVLIFGAIVYALGWRPQGQNTLFTAPGNGKSALDISKERYARGELSKVEFEQIRHDLNS
ncbi:MAG: SHOCT domain-containing protein [Ardenticatenaceae bacterium]|nr:SHOCT domain-containing protein [Anaerolineales bacterium]MCB9010030.1 SHOCT domain-containing protein [Ardenticatenaceae bacterium]